MKKSNKKHESGESKKMEMKEMEKKHRKMRGGNPFAKARQGMKG